MPGIGANWVRLEKMSGSFQETFPDEAPAQFRH